jgi:hypothetical protein
LWSNNFNFRVSARQPRPFCFGKMTQNHLRPDWLHRTGQTTAFGARTNSLRSNKARVTIQTSVPKTSQQASDNCGRKEGTWDIFHVPWFEVQAGSNGAPTLFSTSSSPTSFIGDPSSILPSQISICTFFDEWNSMDQTQKEPKRNE